MEFPPNIIEALNAQIAGYDATIGLRFVSVEPDCFVTELDVDERHLQPYGLVHGGVYASMIETTCSAGAALNVIADGRTAVGLENSTSFLRAVRSGTVRCSARPAFRGKRTHVWEARVEDEEGGLVATGRVRMIVLEPRARAAGATVGLVNHAPPTVGEQEP